jgi:hypothetical protein
MDAGSSPAGQPQFCDWIAGFDLKSRLLRLGPCNPSRSLGDNKETMKNYWLSFAFLLIPQVTWACGVCFGNTNGDLQRGFFWGILLLILLPPALFLAIAGKIYFSIKKKNTTLEKTFPSNVSV